MPSRLFILSKKFSLFILMFCFIFVNCRIVFCSDQFLDTIIQIGEVRDKKIVAAKENLNLANVKVISAARNYFPVLVGQRKYSRGKIAQKKTGTAQEYEYQSEEIGVKGSQTLFEGGKLTATYRYQKLAQQGSMYNYTKTKEELIYKIKLAYYELLGLKMEFASLSKAFDEIEVLDKKNKGEYKSKAISELDMIEADNFRDKLSDLLKKSELNLNFVTKKLLSLININSLDDVPGLMPEGLMEDAPEISFTHEECLTFLPINNLDLKMTQTQILMAVQKRKINRSKVIPKIYLDGFYGQSGETFTTEPLELATMWAFSGKLVWSLWGNSLESTYAKQKTNPNDVIDPSARTEETNFDIKIGLLDDVNYFVENKEALTGLKQAQAEYEETIKKVSLDFEKAYSEYEISTRDVRTLKNEILVKKRKLQLMRKRNELYEVSTLQLMEETWKYAETISAYAKALSSNYSSVVEMEKLTFVSLR